MQKEIGQKGNKKGGRKQKQENKINRKKNIETVMVILYERN